jgi:hypothetical protein
MFGKSSYGIWEVLIMGLEGEKSLMMRGEKSPETEVIDTMDVLENYQVRFLSPSRNSELI